MKIFGFIIARPETIEALVDKRAGEVLDRYAHNPDALRAALVAYNCLYSPDAIPPDSPLLKWMTLAIKAFAAEVVKIRAAGLRPTIPETAVAHPNVPAVRPGGRETSSSSLPPADIQVERAA